MAAKVEVIKYLVQQLNVPIGVTAEVNQFCTDLPLAVICIITIHTFQVAYKYNSTTSQHKTENGTSYISS